MSAQALVHIAILEILHGLEHPVTESRIALALTVTYSFKGPGTLSAVRESLQKLEEGRYIVGLHKELSQVLWAISDKGRGELANY